MGTFTRILLNVTQDKFEELVKRFTAAASQPEAMTERVFCQLIALVSFIGHLYVRKLVAARVIAQVVHNLVGVRDRQPDQDLILCVTELMYIVGRTMDANAQGNTLMDQFLKRLENLAATRASGGIDEAFYPQEVRASVSALYSARLDKWPPRAGTALVLVQYFIPSLQEVVKVRHELHAEKKLPPDQMMLEKPKEDELEGGVHLVVTNMMSGSVMAVLFNVQELSKAGKTAEVVTKLKGEISRATSVHASRIQLFDENSELLDELFEEIDGDRSKATD